MPIIINQTSSSALSSIPFATEKGTEQQTILELSLLQVQNWSRHILPEIKLLCCSVSPARHN